MPTAAAYCSSILQFAKFAIRNQEPLIASRFALSPFPFALRPVNR